MKYIDSNPKLVADIAYVTVQKLTEAVIEIKELIQFSILIMLDLIEGSFRRTLSEDIVNE